jgi:hypothetical protein
VSLENHLVVLPEHCAQVIVSLTCLKKAKHFFRLGICKKCLQNIMQEILPKKKTVGLIFLSRATITRQLEYISKALYNRVRKKEKDFEVPSSTGWK